MRELGMPITETTKSKLKENFLTIKFKASSSSFLKDIINSSSDIKKSNKRVDSDDGDESGSVGSGWDVKSVRSSSSRRSWSSLNEIKKLSSSHSNEKITDKPNGLKLELSSLSKRSFSSSSNHSKLSIKSALTGSSKDMEMIFKPIIISGPDAVKFKNRKYNLTLKNQFGLKEEEFRVFESNVLLIIPDLIEGSLKISDRALSQIKHNIGLALGFLGNDVFSFPPVYLKIIDSSLISSGRAKLEPIDGLESEKDRPCYNISLRVQDVLVSMHIMAFRDKIDALLDYQEVRRLMLFVELLYMDQARSLGFG
jgi:hypothetical protein